MTDTDPDAPFDFCNNIGGTDQVGTPIRVDDVRGFNVLIHDGSWLLKAPNTDAKNAARFIDLFGNQVRYCEPLGWMIFNGTRWMIGAARHVRYLTLVTGLSIGAMVRPSLPEGRTWGQTTGLKARGCRPYRNKTERCWEGVKFPAPQQL